MKIFQSSEYYMEKAEESLAIAHGMKYGPARSQWLHMAADFVRKAERAVSEKFNERQASSRK